MRRTRQTESLLHFSGKVTDLGRSTFLPQPGTTCHQEESRRPSDAECSATPQPTPLAALVRAPIICQRFQLYCRVYTWRSQPEIWCFGMKKSGSWWNKLSGYSRSQCGSRIPEYMLYRVHSINARQQWSCAASARTFRSSAQRLQDELRLQPLLSPALHPNFPDLQFATCRRRRKCESVKTR
jgi:hypothetical protein